MLVDRRDELGRAKTQTINRLLLELVPGGAERFLSAFQARAAIATVRPRDIVGKACRRIVVELIGERLLRNQRASDAAGPRGHSGTTLRSSATDLTPDIGSSDKPQPGPTIPSLALDPTTP